MASAFLKCSEVFESESQPLLSGNEKSEEGIEEQSMSDTSRHLVMPYSHLLRASMSIFTDKGSTEATHHVSRFTYFFLIGSRVFVFCVGGRLLFFYLVLLFQLQNH